MALKANNLGLVTGQKGWKKAKLSTGLESLLKNFFDSLPNTVQYRPSENKIVFGLKVPSGDGLGLILSLK